MIGFWPLSTEERPKQFIDVLEVGRTLIQMTYDRFATITDSSKIYVITNERYINQVAQQLPEVPKENILGEPVMKNTAPVVAWAAHKIKSIDPNGVLVISPSDHLIINERAFNKNLEVAVEEASSKKSILTIGIKPTRPDTGYGYIHFETGDGVSPGEVAKVKKFTEKPHRELAEIFLKSGEYYWNSGIFIWHVDTIIHALNKFVPDLNSLFDFEYDGGEAEENGVLHAFHECENISIDYAVLEHAKNVEVVLAKFSWNDLGTWGSLYSHVERDPQGNRISGDAVTYDIHNSLIKLPQGKKAIIQGLENYIVVESEDGTLLIMQMEKEQQIKEYLKELKK